MMICDVKNDNTQTHAQQPVAGWLCNPTQVSSNLGIIFKIDEIDLKMKPECSTSLLIFKTRTHTDIKQMWSRRCSSTLHIQYSC